MIASPPPAASAGLPARCAGFAVALTRAERRADAARVGAAAGHATRPETVDAVLAAGPWRMVWATPDASEPGVFLFRRRARAYDFVDVWGGVAQDTASARRWATGAHGVDPRLAACFADRLFQAGP